jgi:glycosyltransferase involved in cell wall biosynthesis
VDISLFRPEPVLGPSTRLSFGQGPAVVFTGRLIEAKGLLDLLNAWPILLREVPDAHLVIVGSGALQEELCRRAALPPLAGRVHLTGEVPDVRPYLRAASAFVFPSWAEGFSNALLEAMAMGLPCVVTSVGAVTEVLDGGAAGTLVPPGTLLPWRLPSRHCWTGGAQPHDSVQQGEPASRLAIPSTRWSNDTNCFPKN